MHDELAHSAGSDRKIILFVDDEPLSLKYFKASVGAFADVVTAQNPTAAREVLASQGHSIAVVVSDERMPHESGASFLSEVRQSQPSAVLVLTSAYADFGSLQRAINSAGIHRFIPKPWNLDELCDAMRDALGAEHPASGDTPQAARQIRAQSESAYRDLLAVLSRELATSLSGTQPRDRADNAPSQREANFNQAIALLLVELTRHLTGVEVTSTSMARSAEAALAEVAIRLQGRQRVSLDARRDFRHTIPQQIMSFVLVNLVAEALASVPRGNAGSIDLELVPGDRFNELRIVAPWPDLHDGESTAARLQDFRSPVRRTIRSALWAFAGELLFSSDIATGAKMTCIRLPNASTYSSSGSRA